MDVFSFSFWRRQFLSTSPLTRLTKGEEKKSREERRSEGGEGTGKKKEEEVARRGESFIYTRDILFILADAVSPVSNDTHSVTCYASSTFHPFSGSLYTITSSLRTRQRRVLSTDVKFSTIIDASTMRDKRNLFESIVPLFPNWIHTCSRRREFFATILIYWKRLQLI